MRAISKLHEENEKAIQQEPNIIEANCDTTKLGIKEFLEAVTPYLKRVFKTFVKKYDWKDGSGEICISDVFMLHKDGTRINEAQIFFLGYTSPFYQKAGKLTEKERVLLKERINKLSKDWRVCYE